MILVFAQISQKETEEEYQRKELGEYNFQSKFQKQNRQK